jgi:hypothetical protein
MRADDSETHRDRDRERKNKWKDTRTSSLKEGNENKDGVASILIMTLMLMKAGDYFTLSLIDQPSHFVLH